MKYLSRVPSFRLSLRNCLHSSSSAVPSTSSTPSLSELRIGGPNTSTSPSIDSAAASNATSTASQISKFKELVEYDGNGRLMIAPDDNGFIPAYTGGHMVIEAIKLFYTEPWGSWNEIRLNIRVLMWNQFVVSGDKSSWEVNCIYDGGPKKGRTYGTGVVQSSSTPSLFLSSSSTLQTMEEMKAMKKKIVELTQKCAANDAKFAKFDKLEELVKKHMPQVFQDEEDNESDDNELVVIVVFCCDI
ncbi:hypothetical protein FXO38_14359 [Capsicum annuum]|nr:hypothetical protein FXO38_14359 [Capsicum annuum]